MKGLLQSRSSLALTCLILFTAALAANADQPNCAFATRQARRAKQIVAGYAYIGREHPLVGSRVKITDLRGHPIAAKYSGNNPRSRTFERGTFVQVLRTVPAFMVISVSGGTTNGSPFKGQLKKVIRRPQRDQILDVNPASTMAAEWFLRHSRSSLPEAYKRARNLFALDSHVNMHSSMRTSDRHVYGEHLLTHVRAQGWRKWRSRMLGLM